MYNRIIIMYTTYYCIYSLCMLEMLDLWVHNERQYNTFPTRRSDITTVTSTVLSESDMSLSPFVVLR